MTPAEQAALLDRVAALEEAITHLTEHVTRDSYSVSCPVCHKINRGY